MDDQSVTVVGSLNYDMIFTVDRLPHRGETMPTVKAAFCNGGKGANQAVQCARLGLPTRMVGAVGNDAVGEAMLASLSAEGVDVAGISRMEGHSGAAAVHVLPGGSVHATIFTGANGLVTKADIDPLDSVFAASSIVLLQLEIPVDVVEYAIIRAKAQGCKVLLNAAPAAPISRQILKQCDVLMFNEVEAAFYCGVAFSNREDSWGAVQALSAELGNTCVFTLGENGAIACAKGGEPSFCAPCRVPVAETTGAGDSFAGGFAYALAHEMDLTQALLFSTCCSGVTVQGIGGQTAMPRLEQVAALMASRSADEN